MEARNAQPRLVVGPEGGNDDLSPAGKKLQGLFIHDDWTSRDASKARVLVLEACKILQQHPNEARIQFAAKVSLRLADRKVLPITALLSAGWLDWEHFDLVYQLFPECLEPGRHEGLLEPWPVACRSEGAGLSKQIMTFLFTTPPSRHGPDARVCRFVVRRVGRPAEFYIQHALFPFRRLERSESELETMLDIFKLLWVDHTRWQRLLSSAVAANSDAFIEYIMSKVDGKEYLSFDYNPRSYRMDLRGAYGLEKILPRLQGLTVLCGRVAEVDAQEHVLKALLEGTNHKVKELTLVNTGGTGVRSKQEAKIVAMESFVANTSRILESLTVRLKPRAHYPHSSMAVGQGAFFAAVVGGMAKRKHNFTERLSIQYYDALTLEQIATCFQTGITSLHLSYNQFAEEGTVQSWPVASPSQAMWDACAVHTVKVDCLSFSTQIFCRFMNMLEKLPLLTELHVTDHKGRWRNIEEEDHFQKVTQALLSFLERQPQLQKMTFLVSVDIERVCRHLKGNTSMVDLTMKADQAGFDQYCTLLGNALRDQNVTLESFRAIGKERDTDSNQNPPDVLAAPVANWVTRARTPQLDTKLGCFSALNRIGRHRMRCETLNGQALIDLLGEAMSDLRLLYGLLREAPAKWTSLAAAPAPDASLHKKSGPKRKYEALKEA